MQAIHQVTFDTAKLEHSHRMAKIERERLFRDVPDRAHVVPMSRVQPVARRAAVAFATLVLTLGLAVGAAFAATEAGGDGGCGGGHAVKLVC
jgi:hypothetical protein